MEQQPISLPPPPDDECTLALRNGDDYAQLLGHIAAEMAHLAAGCCRLVPDYKAHALLRRSLQISHLICSVAFGFTLD